MEVVENRPNWLPEGTTEDEVLASIERVVRLVCPSFAFGPHGIDDVMQVGRMEGFILLSKGKFDPAKGRLEAYLIRHISHRMKNLRRSLWRSDDVGCAECYAEWERGNVKGCGADSRECKRFARWLATQSAKVRLANAVPIDVEDAAFQVPDTVGQDVAHAELLATIDERLDPSLRADYLRLREGLSVPGDRQRRVREAVAEILSEVGLFPNGTEDFGVSTSRRPACAGGHDEMRNSDGDERNWADVEDPSSCLPGLHRADSG